MKRAALIVAGLMALALGGEAQALPLAPLAPSAVDAGSVTLVRQGCGFGAHRGFHGGCRLNRGPRGMIRGLTRGAPRRFCPPGSHRVRGSGVCRRNF